MSEAGKVLAVDPGEGQVDPGLEAWVKAQMRTGMVSETVLRAAERMAPAVQRQLEEIRREGAVLLGKIGEELDTMAASRAAAQGQHPPGYRFRVGLADAQREAVSSGVMVQYLSRILHPRVVPAPGEPVVFYPGPRGFHQRKDPIGSATVSYALPIAMLLDEASPAVKLWRDLLPMVVEREPLESFARITGFASWAGVVARLGVRRKWWFGWAIGWKDFAPAD